MDHTVKRIKEELAKVYPDLIEDLPLQNDVKSVQKLREIAGHASATGANLAIYLRGLEAEVKKREAQITLAAIESGKVKTPKEQHIRALVNDELAEAKSYVNQMEVLIDTCRSRVMLVQSLLKAVEKETIL